MRIGILAALAVAQLCAQRSTPDYTQSTIVHGATDAPGPLAPNTLATIYGVNLSANTRALQTSDIKGNAMPVTLPGSGTHVLISGINAPIYYASPTQIKFLVPPNLLPGSTRLTVVVDGISGREARVQIAPVSPAFFLTSPGLPAAVDLDGEVITAAHRVSAGEWAILYATGLGDTVPRAISGQLVKQPTPLAALVTVLLDGVPADINYAGLAPGYVGLYQINVMVPLGTSDLPEIRLDVDGALSPEGVFLPVRKPE